MLLSESDSLLLGNLYQTRSSGQDRLTVIARSRIEGVDLNQLLRPLGGGGHPRAAAVTLKPSNPQFVLTQLVEDLILQIPFPTDRIGLDVLTGANDSARCHHQPSPAHFAALWSLRFIGGQ